MTGGLERAKCKPFLQPTRQGTRRVRAGSALRLSVLDVNYVNDTGPQLETRSVHDDEFPAFRMERICGLGGESTPLLSWHF